VKLLDRWKILLGGITLLPVAGTAFAQTNSLPLADASWEPRGNGQSPVFADTLNAPDAINMYAAHSSHRSHSSHSSHYSGSGGYSAPRYYSPPPASTRSYTAPSSTHSSSSGSTGSSTSNSLYGPSGSANNPSTTRTRPSEAQKNNLVMRVQTALMVRKYYFGKIDGMMGKGTRGALMSFQMDNALTVNGAMDTQTLNALGIRIP